MTWSVGGIRHPASSIQYPDELALRNIDREPASRGFLVLGLHIETSLAHGANDLIERDETCAIAPSADPLFRFTL